MKVIKNVNESRLIKPESRKAYILDEGYNRLQFKELMELSAQYGLEKVTDWQQICDEMHIDDPLEAMRAWSREVGKDFKMNNIDQLLYDVMNPSMPGGGTYVDPKTGDLFDKHNNKVGNVRDKAN